MILFVILVIGAYPVEQGVLRMDLTFIFFYTLGGLSTYLKNSILSYEHEKQLLKNIHQG